MIFHSKFVSSVQITSLAYVPSCASTKIETFAACYSDALDMKHDRGILKLCPM